MCQWNILKIKVVADQWLYSTIKPDQYDGLNTLVRSPMSVRHCGLWMKLTANTLTIILLV